MHNSQLITHNSSLLFSPHVNNQAIEKIPKDLVAAFPVFGMVLAPEKSAYFTPGNLKINQLQYFHDLVVEQMQRYTELFKDVVV